MTFCFCRRSQTKVSRFPSVTVGSDFRKSLIQAVVLKCVILKIFVTTRCLVKQKLMLTLVIVDTASNLSGKLVLTDVSKVVASIKIWKLFQNYG